VLEAPIFNEILAVNAENTRVLGSYASDYYSGEPAVTLHHKGLGRVIHFGSFFTQQNVRVLLEALSIQDPLAAWADVPAETQVTIRSNGYERLYFFLNFTGTTQTAIFKESVFDLLGRQKLQGHTEIPPYGVLFVQRTSRNDRER
jgi:beta-galactosidase